MSRGRTNAVTRCAVESIDSSTETPPPPLAGPSPHPLATATDLLAPVPLALVAMIGYATLVCGGPPSIDGLAAFLG